MDLPQINQEWFQKANSQRFKGYEQSSQIKTLKTDILIGKNYKRFFYVWEILEGYNMLNQIGYRDDQTHFMNNKSNGTNQTRDPQQIVLIFQGLN